MPVVVLALSSRRGLEVVKVLDVDFVDGERSVKAGSGRRKLVKVRVEVCRSKACNWVAPRGARRAASIFTVL